MKRRASDLAARMLRGERTAYEEIVSSYAEDVLRLCYGLLWDREEARDVLQESLLRLVRAVRAGRFRSVNGSVKGFLMTAARNLCIDRLRARIEFRAFDEDETTRNPATFNQVTPRCAADLERFQAAFQDALGRLTPVQRAVWVLFEMNGESYREIASALGLSADGVRSYLHRARRNMRIWLEPFEELR